MSIDFLLIIIIALKFLCSYLSMELIAITLILCNRVRYVPSGMLI